MTQKSMNQNSKANFMLLLLSLCAFFVSSEIAAQVTLKHLEGNGTINGKDCVSSDNNLQNTCNLSSSGGSIAQRALANLCFGNSSTNKKTRGKNCFEQQNLCCGGPNACRFGDPDTSDSIPEQTFYCEPGSPSALGYADKDEIVGYDCNDLELIAKNPSIDGCKPAQNPGDMHLECVPFEKAYQCRQVPQCTAPGQLVDSNLNPADVPPNEGGCCRYGDLAFQPPGQDGAFTCDSCYPDDYAPNTSATPPEQMADCCNPDDDSNGTCGGDSVTPEINLVRADLKENGSVVSSVTGWGNLLNGSIQSYSNPILIELHFSDVAGSGIDVTQYEVTLNDQNFSVGTNNCQASLENDTDDTCVEVIYVSGSGPLLSCGEDIECDLADAPTGGNEDETNGFGNFNEIYGCEGCQVTGNDQVNLGRFELTYNGTTEVINFSVGIENTNEVTCYRDADEDGYGDDNDTLELTDCDNRSDYIDRGGDCCDNDSSVYPNAPPNRVEILSECSPPGGSWDYNCDGAVEPAIDYIYLGSGSSYFNIVKMGVGCVRHAVIGNASAGSTVSTDSSHCGNLAYLCHGTATGPDPDIGLYKESHERHWPEGALSCVSGGTQIGFPSCAWPGFTNPNDPPNKERLKCH